MSQPTRPPSFDEAKKFAEESGFKVVAQRPIRDYDEEILASIEAEYNETDVNQKFWHLLNHLSDAQPFVEQFEPKKLVLLEKMWDDVDRLGEGGPKLTVRQTGSYGHVVVMESSTALGGESRVPPDSRIIAVKLDEDHRTLMEKKYARLVRERGWVDKLLADHDIIPRKPKGSMPGIGGGSA